MDARLSRIEFESLETGALQHFVAIGHGLSAALIVLTSLDAVDTFAVLLNSPIDTHPVLRLSIAFDGSRTQLPASAHFYFL